MTRVLQTLWKSSDGQRSLISLQPGKAQVHLFEATLPDLIELQEALEEAIARMKDSETPPLKRKEEP